MKVFVAGATGVLGRELVPQLVARGHEVVGMTRSPSKQDLVRSLGARPVVADALDPDAVAQAVASAEPEVIVHELTALSGHELRDARHLDRFFETTNRLRTEGTDHLLAAGRAVGARRFVAQSFGAFRFARTGGPVQTEADPLDPDPPAALRAGAGGVPLSGAGGDDDRVGRGSRVALRRLLRAGDRDQPGSGRADGGADPQAPVPDRRRRRRRLVARPRRRRRDGDRRSRSSAAGRASTTSSTTTPRPCGSGCRCWRARWTPSRRGASHAGWGGWRPARRRRS